MAEELTFYLEEFEGPLELLLALVSKHKMDLHNIPILELIDQYTRTVEQADPDPETASAFIEMAAHLVEMKSYLLLPRSEEGERMKQEFTGQLIEYDQCRRMASALRAAAEATPTFVRQPMQLERDETYALNHLPQVLADCWESLMGRAPVRRMPTQAVFEPEKFIKFMEAAKQFGKPVQVGIIIPKSAGMCKFMNKNVAGVHIPDALIEELQADKEKTKAGITGVEIAARIIRECKPYCQGVHIMSLGWESKIPALLEQAGLK